MQLHSVKQTARLCQGLSMHNLWRRGCSCCRVHLRAWEVGGKRLAVQATLTSRCAHVVTITACQIQPQVPTPSHDCTLRCCDIRGPLEVAHLIPDL